MDDLNQSLSHSEQHQERDSTPILRIRDLRTEFATEYGVVKAVNGVSFDVAEGETLGIVGESGSGKTVTMLSVMQLIESPPGRIARGEILFNGDDLLKLSPKEMRRIRGSRIAMVFQDPLTSLNPVFSIGEQIIETIRLHLRLSKKEAKEHAKEALARVGIPDPAMALDAFPHQFSGGMRQRAMIAMAITCNPSLLIADEPTSALDVTVQEQLLQLIDDIRSQMRMSIVWITHDLGVIAGLADRVLVMYAGEIVESGPTETILVDPCHPYTQGLLQSIPRLDTPRGEKLKPIEGTPPDMIHLSPSCQFAPRCRHRLERCAEHPPLSDVGPEHVSRCWVNPKAMIVEQDSMKVS